MADSQRIEDLRRRVQKDPASIAFAQLAEELRRAGGFEEAVNVCRAGLQLHPGYLSARVTLGRALLELNELDAALAELELVLKSAPENLAAIRGLAEIHHRQGSLAEALKQYRAALALARNDPELQQTVTELERKVEPPKPPASADGLSFEQVQNEFLQNLPPPPSFKTAQSAPPQSAAPQSAAPQSAVAVSVSAPVEPADAETASAIETAPAPETAPATETAPAAGTWWTPPSSEPAAEPRESDEHRQARQTIGALEQFLDAIHVSRAQPRA